MSEKLAENTVTRYSIRCVDDFACLAEEDRMAWHSIVESQSDALPFNTLFWNQSWWTKFGVSSPNVENRLLIYVVERDAQVVAFFPMYCRCLLRFGYTFLRHISPLGGDRNLTELRAGVVRPEFRRQAYQALVMHLRQTDADWDIVSLPAVPTVLSDIYEGISIDHPKDSIIEGFAVELASDWDTFRAGLKRNIRESIRKCHNAAKREGVDLDFVCLRDPDDLARMLPEFYRLHAIRAGYAGGPHHRDVFDDVDAREFIGLLARDPAASGIRLFLLRHDERTVAARLGFELGKSTYLYYSGYDLAYGKYSIMTRLVIEVMKSALEARQKTVHLSFGRDVSKTRWSPRETSHQWKVMFRKSLRGRAAALALQGLTRIRRRKKGHHAHRIHAG